MSSILFELRDSIGFITLNRPDKLNSFNREMSFQLQEALDKCIDPVCRAVFITGAGKAFSAGQDLAEVVEPGGPDTNQILAEHYNPIVTRIRKLEKPVIAAVNGVAAGAGANMALSCDIVVAAKSASFLQAFSKIGLVPDTGGTFILPRLIGWQKASALMMLAEKISADEAEKLGMIYKVFTDEEFLENANLLVYYLSKMPTKGLAYTKMLLSQSFDNGLEEQLDQENIFQQRAASTTDYKEGVQAFLEKRQPTFTGN
jgi:2-(1,2-epoxy-1,2-dihydrophenyl)acetyl-CoA isomerase